MKNNKITKCVSIAMLFVVSNYSNPALVPSMAHLMPKTPAIAAITHNIPGYMPAPTVSEEDTVNSIKTIINPKIIKEVSQALLNRPYIHENPQEFDRMTTEYAEAIKLAQYYAQVDQRDKATDWIDYVTHVHEMNQLRANANNTASISYESLSSITTVVKNTEQAIKEIPYTYNAPQELWLIGNLLSNLKNDFQFLRLHRTYSYDMVVQKLTAVLQTSTKMNEIFKSILNKDILKNKELYQSAQQFNYLLQKEIETILHKLEKEVHQQPKALPTLARPIGEPTEYPKPAKPTKSMILHPIYQKYNWDRKDDTTITGLKLGVVAATLGILSLLHNLVANEDSNTQLFTKEQEDAQIINAMIGSIHEPIISSKEPIKPLRENTNNSIPFTKIEEDELIININKAVLNQLKKESKSFFLNPNINDYRIVQWLDQLMQLIQQIRENIQTHGIYATWSEKQQQIWHAYEQWVENAHNFAKSHWEDELQV